MDAYAEDCGSEAWARSALRPCAGDDGGVHWQLRKNCSLAPLQLAKCLVSVSVPGLLAGVAFFALGAPVILAFVVAQGAVLAWCFVQYAQHAADRESLSVSRNGMEVCVVNGSHEMRHRFSPATVRLQMLGLQHNMVSISEQGRAVQVGTYVPQHWRPWFYRDLCEVTRQFH